MASTYTDLLRFEEQADGENENTWGQILNEQLDLAEDAIAGLTPLVLAGADVTLTTANGAPDQARRMILDLTGTITADINIIVPALTKVYIVRNGTTQTVAETVTIKVSGETGVEVPNASTLFVFCDGTDVFAVNADAVSLGGVPAASFARRDEKNTFTASQVVVPVEESDTDLTPDLDLTNNYKMVPTAAFTISDPINTAGKDMQGFLIKVQQGGVPFGVTWGSKYRFAGTAPSGTAVAGAVDLYSCMYDEDDDLVYVTYSLNVITPA